MIKQLLQQRFFWLLSEYSQHKVSASELTKAIKELATHVTKFSINEQDYNVLLRYFSFGLHRLKSKYQNTATLPGYRCATKNQHLIFNFLSHSFSSSTAASY